MWAAFSFFFVYGPQAQHFFVFLFYFVEGTLGKSRLTSKEYVSICYGSFENLNVGFCVFDGAGSFVERFERGGFEDCVEYGASRFFVSVYMW